MSEKPPKQHLFFRLQEYLGLVFFSLMCALMVLQLLSRYLFSRPLLFTEEFSRLSYVWIAFLGMAVAHRRRDHIRIDLFINMLAPGLRRTAEVVIELAGCVILAYLCCWGVEYMIFNQWNVAASVDLPLYYVYAALPTGCALGIVNIVCNLLAKPQPAR